MDVNDSRLNHVANEIHNLLVEIHSEKISNRNKATDRLNAILSNQKSEIIIILENDEKFCVNWSEIYTSVMDSIEKHTAKLDDSQNSKSYQTMLNRNSIYSAIMTKVINYGAEAMISFPVSIILERFFSSFDNRSILKHFGSLLMQILENAVLYHDSNYSKIKIQDFSRLLAYLFDILEKKKKFPLHYPVLKNLNKIILAGSNNLQISYELNKFQLNMKNLCQFVESYEEHHKNEIIKLIFLFVKNIAIDFHKSACDLLQNLLPKILTFYEFRMKHEIKEFFWNLCNLSIVLHYPKINLGNTKLIVQPTELYEWNKMLKQIFSIISKDINRNYSTGKIENLSVSNNFIKLSSNLSYLVFWENLLRDISENSRCKLLKTNQKFDAIVDLIKDISGIPNWIWFNVLNELLINYSIPINSTEYKDIIELILYSLNHIKHSNQLCVIVKCCESLLYHENNYFKNQNIQIDENFWDKICNLATSDSSVQNDEKLIIEKYKFLQILLKNKKITTQNTICSLTQNIISKPIKNQIILQTIKIILIYYGDILLKSIDLIKGIITWIHSNEEKLLLSDSPSEYSGLHEENIDLISEISVLSITKIMINDSMSNMNKSDEHNEFENEIRTYLSYKYLEKSLFYDGQEKSGTFMKNSPFLTIVTLNETYFDILLKTMKLDLNELSAKESEAIIRNVIVLEKGVILMDKFLEMKILNSEKQLIPLTKRIAFLLNTIDMQIHGINLSEFNLIDLQLLIQKFENIFKIFYEYKDLNLIMEIGITNISSFIMKIPDKRKLMKQFDDNEGIQKLIKHSLKTLAICNCYETNSNEIWECLKRFYNSNLVKNDDEAETLFSIFEIYYNQKSNKIVSEWIMEQLQDICKMHHTNKKISEMIILHLPGILNYTKDDVHIIEDICIIVSSFLKKCFKNLCSVDFTIKTILSLKQYIKIHCDLLKDDKFIEIFKSINKFIISKSLIIQFSAIELFIHLIDSNWSFNNKIIPKECFILYSDLYLNLLSNLNKVTEQENSSEEIQDNMKLIRLQLWLSIAIVCPLLRQRSLKDLSEFCIENPNVHSFLRNSEICNKLFKTMSEDVVESIIYNLFSNKCTLEKLPWYLLSSNEKDFYKDNIAILAFCLLQTSTEDIYALKARNNIGIMEILDVTIPIYQAFILPYLSKLKIQNINYSSNVKNIMKNLKNYCSEDHIKIVIENNLWKILYYIFQYLWDEKKFKEYFGFNLLHEDNRSLIFDYATAKSCLQYLLNSTYKENNFKNLLKKESIQIIKLCGAIKLQYEKSLNSENKLIHIFRYCCVMELILESITSEFCNGDLQRIRNFFVKDVICFFGHILNDDKDSESLKLASLYYLRKFSKIIMEKYSDALGQCLKLFIRQIVNLIEKSSNNELIINNCFELLNFLIRDSYNNLREFICDLDDFPSTEKFIEFYNIRDMLKRKIVSKNLKDDFERFIENNDRNFKELEILKGNISKRKSDLKEMCQNILLNCEENLLHRTVIHLLEIIRCTEKDSIAIEAGKCLGEIGPADLRIIALNNVHNTVVYKTTSNLQGSIDCFIETSAKSLINLIFSQNQEICTLSNDVCYIIANTNKRENFIDEYEQLYPYVTSNNLKNIENLTFDEVKKNTSFIQIFNDSKEYSYAQWIKYFTSNLYECLGWNSFKKLAAIETSFCESTIVPLVKIFLKLNSEICKNLENFVNHFFEETSKILTENNNVRDSYNIFCNKSIIRVFLNIAESIRIYKQSLNESLEMNCLHIAKACTYCEAYFMAILYSEIWALHEKDLSDNVKRENLIANRIFQDVAKESYKSIGITDAIEGFLDPISSRFEYLSSQNKWTDIIIELDSLNNSNNSNLQLQQMKWNGLLSLTSKVQTENHEIDYEICWRLADWDKLDENNVDFDKFNKVSDQSIEFHHFQALKSINKKNKEIVIDSIEKGRKCIVSILKNISTECTQTVYKYALWLQLFQQIEDFSEIQFLTNATAEGLLDKWDEQDEITFGNNEHKEITISQKLCLIQSGGIRAERRIKECSKGQDIIGNYMLRAINACNEANKQNLAIRYISCLRQMDVDCDIKINALLEDAKMNWNLSNTALSKAILHHIVTKDEYGLYVNKVDALRTYGVFLAETNSETFDILHEKFFKGSLTLLNNFKTHKEILLKKTPNQRNLLEFDKFSIKCRKDNYLCIAKYADREYVELTSYMNSDAFKTKLKLMQMNKDVVNKERENQIKDRDKLITINIMVKNSGIDDNEIKVVEAKRTEYLCLAVINYINCCILEDTIKTTTLYRVLALWFSNKSNSQLINEIENCIYKIQNYKFICLLDQIMARLGNSNEQFMNIIKNILLKCAQEHPHHTLPKLLALRNANADGNSKSLPNDSRCLAVQQILDKIKPDEYAYNCKLQLQFIFSALIDFSNKQHKEDKKKIVDFSISDNLRKLKNLQYVHCLTMELSVSKNNDYSNITSINKWDNVFSFVGGINAPKKINCFCSDGIKRPQLLKGKDDLRQDAVMMQALQIVNDLFNENKKDNLHIRTYKVVPLSKRSGILEWCENTIPLGTYLSGEDRMHGAHKKYRPQDYTVRECRQMMQKKVQSSYEDKLKTFLEVCSHIKPVLHYFFLENFLTPGLWFQRRLSYINSVATTSIVGYVLGLGDRHVHNILIDKKTAEFIHIDFGIAFEQGKIMPTPETIPFRLTRDIVAAMGICEIDGVFRKFCEQVMSILRKNQSVLMTILEVLLYDPLYSWILNSKKIMKSQNIKFDVNSDELEEKNTTAERALLRVKSKLDGMDEAGIGVTNVDVQVQRLIKQAMNPKNLCRVFPGWEPYL